MSQEEKEKDMDRLEMAEADNKVEYCTAKEWAALGCVVLRHEASHRKNENGEPLYSEDQVVDRKDFDFDDVE